MNDWYAVNVREWFHIESVESFRLKPEDAKSLSLLEKIHAYEEFKQLFPASKHITRANERLDELLYEYAQTENRFEAYERYILTIPNGRYVEEIKQSGKNLLQEVRAFNVAMNTNTISAYNLFIDNYPESRFVHTIKG